MKSILCFCLVGLLVACINANSISIASQRSTSDVPANVSEDSKQNDDTHQKSVNAEAQSDAAIRSISNSQSETKEDPPSDMGTRSLFSSYGDKSRFGSPFPRPPWLSRKYNMFPASPFFDELESSYYGSSSRYGNEYEYPSMRYDEQYPDAYRRYGMVNRPYDGSFYPGESQGTYPTYNQQLQPSSSYYNSRPGETNAQPQEYYRGRPVESQPFSTQGTPYDRNRIESRVQPQRFSGQATPYDRNQPQQFVSPSTPYYQDQRRESQPLASSPTSYNQDQRKETTNVPAQAYRDQRTNSNVAGPDASVNAGYGILRREPESKVVVPDSLDDRALQPQSVAVPPRNQRTETNLQSTYSTTAIPVSSDDRITP